MTVVEQEQGYAERPYAEETYLTPSVLAGMGLQFQAVIESGVGTVSTQAQGRIEGALSGPGVQFLGHIQDRPSGLPLEAQGLIDSGRSSFGLQFVAEVEAWQAAVGTEGLVIIEDHLYATGIQARADVLDFTQGLGVEFSGVPATLSPIALQFVADVGASPAGAVQFLGVVEEQETAAPVQMGAYVLDFKTAAGIQGQGVITSGIRSGALEFLRNTLLHTWVGYAQEAYGVEDNNVGRMYVFCPLQFQAIVPERRAAPLQFSGRIDTRRSLGLQFKADLYKTVAVPVQFQALVGTGLGLQYRAALYNTTNLRILYEFPSRGLTGSNWTASSTAPGDFSINNVNTDVVEQVYRSGPTTTGVLLTCDTQVPQGVFLDTLAILNHNLTTSAIVQLLGSNDSSFGTVGSVINLSVTRENLFYISPTLPLEGFRYWRLQIDDATNNDGFIQVGTIVFGESVVFQGESFSNPISYRKRHFSDQVVTEGFTSVNNDRGIKRSVALKFENLRFTGGNYGALQNVFDIARTNLKCLWIPTPTYPSRYAVFGKLTELPEEDHQDVGEEGDYVSLNVEVDEAK